MKKFIVGIYLLLICAVAPAQTTKVRGRVTEADTGEGIPFAGVFFKGTTIGLTTDMDGYYSIETRSPEARILVCQILGYDVQEQAVSVGSFSTVNFQLKLTDNKLKGVVVKADNRKIKRLLSNIDSRRNMNDPEKKPSYSCEIYNKMELDLAHAEERLSKLRLLKDFKFIFDYMDTSAVNGVPYLPTMISESFVKRYHSSDPDADSETIIANKISGINPDNNNIISQFTGSMHLKINFYKPFINCFDVELPSPLQNSGLLYYNYFIVDSLQVDGRKTYLVHYHPKEGISSPAFDGEMQIDAEDFALRSIHAKMKHGSNVNWLRDIVIDSEYQRLSDSTWFYSKDKMYADFAIVLRDSSKMLSVMGTRELNYSNVSFEPVDDIALSKVVVSKDANNYDEAFWESKRPYRLTEKEKGIYKMVDEIKEVPLYKSFYDIVYMLVNGYFETGPVGFGPYSEIISFNNLEGARVKLGMHTSTEFSERFRLTGYLAYGFKDKEFKGGFAYEHVFNKEPTRKLTLMAKYDMSQLGRSKTLFADDNIISSALGKSNAQKLCPMTQFAITYEHEVNINVNTRFDVVLNRFYGNSFVPTLALNGKNQESVASNEIHAAIRFSKDETVNRGRFDKMYLHTNYPVLTIELAGGIPGLRKDDYGFFRPEVTLDWKFRIPPVGMSKIHINGGTIIGTVPYHLLHLHEGNGTYTLDKKAFSCMDYFEFASDTWATFFWSHTFNGFFLGKIPLIKALKLREEFSFKAAYGVLSDKNNPTKINSEAPIAFPEGMKTMGNMPYMEIGAGISNILRLLRVDCFWRLTHRENANHRFSVTLGLEFRF